MSVQGHFNGRLIFKGRFLSVDFENAVFASEKSAEHPTLNL